MVTTQRHPPTADPPRRQAGQRTRRSRIAAPVLLVCALAWPTVAQQVQVRRMTGAKGAAAGDSGGAVIEQSPPVVALFKRAREGIARQDWKLAIDSLQRIVDDPQGSLLERQEGLYESARRSAQREIAALPAEGLTAYRLLYDGVAKGLYDRAAAAHDTAGLQTVVDRYLLTRYGPRAGDLLASWYLDAGRGSEALSVLKLIELAPDADVPLSVLVAKRCVALALAGQGEAARKLAAEFSPAPEAPATRTAELVALVEQIAGTTALARSKTAGGVAGDEWPVPGGTPERRGLMPAVRPALIGDLPWRVALPGITDGLWRGLAVPDVQENENAGLPTYHAVAAGGRLFVRGPDGCMALDLEGFDVLWRVEQPAEPRAEIRTDPWGNRLSAPSPGALAAELEDRLFHDSVQAAISIGADLVFSIEADARSNSSRGQQTIIINAPGRPRRNVIVDGNGQPPPNRLVAREAAGGRIRWERGGGAASAGREREANDQLATAIFRATPIAVDGGRVGGGAAAGSLTPHDSAARSPAVGLWAPCMFGNDLYAVVLDPADGRLVDRVLLCSLPGTFIDYDQALPIALGERILYVPTDQGRLFAIDVDERELLWAASYPRAAAAGMAAPAVSGEDALQTGAPPVVVGPLVLLMPADTDQLLAFDRISGELRWSTPRRTHHYLIGTDGDSVFLGGSTAARVALADGKYVWTDRFGTACGHAALSGATIYLPTTGGLVAIGAANGQPFNLGPQDDSEGGTGPGPASNSSAVRPLLGNLLCIAGAMFSVDTREVRKFPDLEQSYPQTLAEQRSHPTDPRLCERLAWMELFRGFPDRAIEALAQVSLPELGAASPDDQRRAGRIAHLRVEALIALARRPDTSAEAAGDYLRQAVQAARSPADMFKTRYSLGDRLAHAAHYEEAYAQLIDLRTSDLSQMIVPCWESDGRMSPLPPASREARGKSSPGGAERPAREVVGDLLRSVAAHLEPQRQRELLSAARREVEQAVQALQARGAEGSSAPAGKHADDGIVALRRIADADIGEGVRPAALLALGRFETGRGRAERAEQYFSAAARSSGPAASVAEALAALVDLYLSPPQRLAAPAADLLMTLTRRFAGLRAAFPVLADGSAQASADTARVAVDEWVAQRQSHMDAGALAAQRAGIAPGPFRLRSQQAWGHPLGDGMQSPRLIHCASAAGDPVVRAATAASTPLRPAAMADRVIVYAPPNEIRAYGVADGKQQWAAELRLPDDFDDGTPDPTAPIVFNVNVMQQPAMPPDAEPAAAVVDGQTMIVSSLRGIHAVGLISGKRLWAKRYHSFVAADRTRLLHTDLLAASGGLVACMLQPRRLSVLRTLDGDVVWERELDNKAVAFVQMFGEYVTTLDPLFQTVHVYRRSDGYEVSVLAFRQPNDDAYIAPVGCFGPDGGLAFCGPDGHDIVAYEAASGQERWRSPSPFGAGLPTLSSLFRAGGGALGAGYAGHGIVLLDAANGHVIGDVALAEYRGGTIDAAMQGDVLVLSWTSSTARGERGALAAIELAAARVLWTHLDLNLLPVGAEQLCQVSGVIPVMMEHGARGATGGDGTVDLLTLDARSGQPTAAPVSLLNVFAKDRPDRLTGDLLVWPGVMFVGTTREIIPIATESAD